MAKFWYKALIALILIMISVGGITRLTRSGLSIVEWKPITGIIPPLTETAWQEEFTKYQNSPEFQKNNSHFELADYKRIFIWEYLHRVLGRLIFLWCLLGGLILVWRRQLNISRVLILSLFIATQGLIGWLMVKSGLVDAPHVNPVKLALHFFAALSLLLLCYVWSRPDQERHFPAGQDRAWLGFFSTVLIIQIFYGCLTAGWKAGFFLNEFPLMSGRFFPTWQGNHSLLWNLFDNLVVVQWIHRWTGILLLAISLGLIWIWRTSNPKGAYRLALLVFLQALLGVFTLIYAVPTSLGVAHQLLASLLALFTIHLWFFWPRKSAKR